MNKYPEIVVGVFIANKKGEIALFKSSKWEKGIWVPPGGHVEYGETLEAAAKREVLEEVGVNVKKIQLIRFDELVESPLFYKKAHLIFFHYLCLIDSSKFELDNDEIIEYKWFSLEDILNSSSFDEIIKKTVKIIKEKCLL